MKSRSAVLVLGLGLLVAGCATDPLTDSVGTVPGATLASLKRLGQATMETGDYASAAGFYRRAHEQNESDFEALLGLGTAMSRLGAHDEAVRTLRKALAAQPGDPDARRELGNALVALGQPSLAIAEFEASFDKKQDARCLNGMGVALDMLGEQAAAQEQYQAGLRLEPGNLSIRNNLALSFAVSGKYADSLRLLEPIARQPNATPRQRQNLALIYGLAGNRDKAAAVARLDLDEISVRRNLAFYETLRAMGDPRKVAEAVGLRARAGGPNGLQAAQ
jgi:Flp pilus assembly protein TadD